jgi:hypothetical protein
VLESREKKETGVSNPCLREKVCADKKSIEALIFPGIFGDALHKLAYPD